MQEYKKLIRHIIENGDMREDRTGVGTLSVFGYQSRYDLQDGFPATTTKKLAWKSVVSELLWMLSGSTDERSLAEFTYTKDRSSDGMIQKNTIWTANANKQGVEKNHPNGDYFKLLGPVYGNQFRNICDFDNDSITEIEIRNFVETYKTPETIVCKNDDCDGLVGKIVYGNSGRSAVVIEKIGKINKSNSDYYKIQSEDTRIVQLVSKTNIDNKKILPKLRCGVGDSYYAIEKPIFYKRALKMWQHMIDRCYDTTHKNYDYYGGRGVYVCKRWHIFYNFIKDIVNMPGFYGWLYNNFEIDKDYYGSNVYSPYTSVFMPPKNNKLLRNTDIYSGEYKYCLEDGNGFKTYFINPYKVVDVLGLTYQGLNYAIINDKKMYNKYKLTKTKVSNGKIYRYKWFHDQLLNVIKEINDNPDSRRIMINLWNVKDLENMALMPCHVLIQFYVSNGKLSCSMYQRSADVFLGSPFNIAFYSLLTHIIARHCNLNVGEFIYSIGDAHIYSNHIEQIETVMANDTYSLPKLNICESFNLENCIKNGFDMKDVEKFTLLEYKHNGIIKAPMAV